MAYKIDPVQWTKTINRDAGILIVGITPGNNQNQNSGSTGMKAKKENAFCGTSLRNNLVKMLDAIGVNTAFGVRSCSEFWDASNNDADFTSILENATYVVENGSKKMLNKLGRLNKDSELSIEFEKFKEHLKDYKNIKLIVTCGKQVYSVVDKLQKDNMIGQNVKIICIPHPSGSNAGQVAAFLDPSNQNGKTATKMRQNAWNMRKEAVKIAATL